MGLLDVLNGMQNGPRGPKDPTASGGMSPITMAVLALLAYKAVKHVTGSTGTATAPTGGNSTLPGSTTAPSGGMATGGLSYSKVREISRVASAETEDYLLSIAEHGTASHVEKLVRAYRRSQEAEELSREARQQESRRVTCWHDDDGSLVLNCRLPAEAGEILLKALDLAVDQLPTGNLTVGVPAGTPPVRERFSARRADALAGRVLRPRRPAGRPSRSRRRRR